MSKEILTNRIKGEKRRRKNIYKYIYKEFGPCTFITIGIAQILTHCKFNQKSISRPQACSSSSSCTNNKNLLFLYILNKNFIYFIYLHRYCCAFFHEKRKKNCYNAHFYGASNPSTAIIKIVYKCILAREPRKMETVRGGGL